MDDQNERKRFEAWANAHGESSPDRDHENPDQYDSCETQREWFVWQAALASSQAATLGRAEEQRNWEAVEEAAATYVEDYEMCGETEDGHDTVYTPTEHERNLLLDCVMGLLADDDFVRALAANPQQSNESGGVDGHASSAGGAVPGDMNAEVVAKTTRSAGVESGPLSPNPQQITEIRRTEYTPGGLAVTVVDSVPQQIASSPSMPADSNKGAAMTVVIRGHVESINVGHKGNHSLTLRLESARTQELFTVEAAPQELAGLYMPGTPIQLTLIPLVAAAPAPLSEKERFKYEPDGHEDYEDDMK